MYFIPVLNLSDFASVTSTVADLGGTMGANDTWQFVSSTNCWIRQGSCKLVTFTTQADAVDGDFFTITVDGTAVVYEFDKAGDGVTAGRVQVNISSDTTAATVAARARTAILANQTMLEVTDNANGTLTICAPYKTMTITENVTHASFTIAVAAVTASAGAGSMFVPAAYPVFIEGRLGPQVGVIRSTADGGATLTPVKIY